MVVRRDQRRRRVIMDESARVVPERVVEQPVLTSEPEVSKAECRLYSPRVKGRSFRTTDLLPKRIRSLVFMGIALFTALLGLNLFTIWGAELEKYLGPQGVAALQLTGPGKYRELVRQFTVDRECIDLSANFCFAKIPCG